MVVVGPDLPEVANGRPVERDMPVVQLGTLVAAAATVALHASAVAVGHTAFALLVVVAPAVVERLENAAVPELQEGNSRRAQVSRGR